jgi:hypothetical protein
MEDVMKNRLSNVFSHPTTARVAIIVTLALALAAPAFAVSNSEVLRLMNSRSVPGNPTLTNLGERVSVNLGANPVPIVVTWQADVANAGRFLVGISVNGAPCIVPGAGQIPYFLGSANSNPPGYAPNGFNNISMQWIVLPSDGLLAGQNTIDLCSGGFASGSSFLLGFRTLTVRKGN